MTRWNEIIQHRKRLYVTLLFATLTSLAVGLPSLIHAQATITIVNLDDEGEGFNDPRGPDDASTTGGNVGSTFGEQRLVAFQYAANIWANLLNSSEEIVVGAQFNQLLCGATYTVLGSSGPKTVHRDFTGAPVSNTWYPAALANSIADTDLAPLDDDISAVFNSALDGNCAFPRTWYYGLDGNPPANTIDFVSIVLHELGHGLGFQTFVDLATGAKLNDFDDIFMLWLENHSTGDLYTDMTDAGRVSASINTGNLHWVGHEVVEQSGGLISGRDPNGHVEMYAPNPLEPGSSVSHFSPSLRPDELMEPSYMGATQDVGLAKSLMQDIGWSTTLQPFVTTGSADAIDFNSATLNGTVKPNGSAGNYYFEYGTTTDYGFTTPVTDIGPGTIDVPVSAEVSNLDPETTYHFRIVATNSTVTSFGLDATFDTIAAPTEYTLLINQVGSGIVTFDPTGGTYPAETVVTLTASGIQDGVFGGWSGALTGFENSETITMDSNKSVTATFIDVVLESGIQLTSVIPINPNDIKDISGRPDIFLYALIEMTVEVADAGDIGVVRVVLPSPAPAGYNWYKYTDDDGWILFDRDIISDGAGDGAEFNTDRTQITVYITDNGPYDDDPANGVIFDLSGLGKSAVLSPIPPSSNSGGGGGCFIYTIIVE